MENQEIKTEKVYLGKNIGCINSKNVLVYETYRNFYKHQYNLERTYQFEEELINILKEKGVSWIRIIEDNINQTSNIKERKVFFFPIKLFENNKLVIKTHHQNAGFNQQIGICRDILEHFEEK